MPPTADPVPLTERVLRRLGPPRWLWILLWALIALAYSTAIRLTGPPLGPDEIVNTIVTQAVLAWAAFVLLWGGGLVARQATGLSDDIAQLAPGDPPTGLFGRIGSIRGPLALTAVVSAIASANGWARYGPIPPLASLPLLFAYLLPILTFVWVYVTILVDIDRLGRRPLALDRFPQDRTLGLEKLGSLASTGLGLVLIAAAPVLIAGADDPVTFGLGLAVVAVVRALFAAIGF